MKTRQIWVRQAGGTEVLQLEEATLAAPQADEVMVHVDAVGLTRADVMARKGRPHPGSPPIPIILGLEIAGTIEAVGADVHDFKVGQRVVSAVESGGCSDYVNIPAWRCIALPDAITDPIQAAASIVNYWTAYYILNRASDLKPGQRILIHGVGGGLGTALVHMAIPKQLEIYGTASAQKHDTIRTWGVTPIDYRGEDFVQRIQQLTGDGVDLVTDPIGGPNWRRSYQTLRRGGKVIICGYQAMGDKPMPANLPHALSMLRRALQPDGKFVGFVGLNPASARDVYRQDVTQIMQLLADGVFTPIIGATYPLEEVAAAHQAMEDGAVVGKIVLIP